MKETEIQADIINNFLKGLCKDDTLPSCIKIRNVMQNHESKQKEIKVEELSQYWSEILLGATKEGMDYTLLYVPLLSNRKIFIGFLKPQKKYMIWKFLLDSCYIENIKMDLHDLLFLNLNTDIQY